MLAKPKLDAKHEACLRAAEYIEEHGWWDGKGPYLPKKGESACLMLALANVSAPVGSYDLVHKYILPVAGLADWNDSHTKDEVVDLLYKIAYSCPK